MDRYEHDRDRLVNVIQQALSAGSDQQKADLQASVEQARQAPRLASPAGRDNGTLDDVRARPLIQDQQRARRLIIHVGDQRYTFDTDVIAGRSGPLNVSDEYVDGRHAHFQVAHNSWYVSDLGSTNGTWLNARRVAAPQRLRKGDKIRIGQTIVIVESA
jgi:hypothetical protein